MAVVFAGIPSPSDGVLSLGPFDLHAYGLFVGLGVLAGVWLSTRRWVARGGKPDDITTIAIWSVPAGLIGARIYHVVTDFQLYENDLLSALAIWDGGLGIWGGITAGAICGMFVAHKRGLDPLVLADVTAPGIVLAQAIGRWGNYFNQELFGGPSDLPWAIRIDIDNRPIETLLQETYHPTFLYESLWNLFLCGMLLLISRRLQLRPGSLFATYVAGYTFARFFIEGLRVDPANTILGLRINEWTSAIVFFAAVVVLYLRERRKDLDRSLNGGV